MDYKSKVSQIKKNPEFLLISLFYVFFIKILTIICVLDYNRSLNGILIKLKENYSPLEKSGDIFEIHKKKN